MTKSGRLLLTGCLVVLLVISNSGCREKLDDDGGYYDEKTRTYKFVKPKRRGLTGSFQQVFAPQPGVTQTVSGTVAAIGADAKSVWIWIEDRKTYMILATSLSGNSRDDKNKRLLLNLSYVSPAASISGSTAFRQKWKKYAIQVLGNQLANRQILAEINYAERSRRFFGNVYQTVKTSTGSQTRDFNLWMVQQGISFYFIDKGRSPKDKEYTQAQNNARKAKLGVWKY